MRAGSLWLTEQRLELQQASLDLIASQDGAYTKLDCTSTDYVVYWAASTQTSLEEITKLVRKKKPV